MASFEERPLYCVDCGAVFADAAHDAAGFAICPQCKSMTILRAEGAGTIPLPLGKEGEPEAPMFPWESEFPD